jgi:hypothetical protein
MSQVSVEDAGDIELIEQGLNYRQGTENGTGRRTAACCELISP